MYSIVTYHIGAINVNWAAVGQELMPVYTALPFILEKYGNPYKNPTASIKSYWELGSRVPPQFPSVVLILNKNRVL